MINREKLSKAPEKALHDVRRRLQREQNLKGALSTSDSIRLMAVTQELDRRHAK
jgi:hypothetical protein